jgi:molybdopterin molybdotransferase
MNSGVLSFDEALARVRAGARELRPARGAAERVELGLAAGRVLAEPLRADRDQPPFARSTRDGYACRAAEAMTHAFLPVVGSIRAGQSPTGPLPPGAAWEIMTGAPVPDGADAVVMLEHVEAVDGRVRLLEPRAIGEGENIVPLGAEARAGDEVLQPGARLGAAQIALAASCGYAELPVFPRPRVAILTTGDELVRVEATPGPGQIRNSNAPMLAALVSAAGGKPWILPAAADESCALDDSLEQAAGADLLVISGGVSAGKFDLVEDALARVGAEFHFTGVRIQPGKPTVFGERPRDGRPGGVQPFFGLPGNPISSAATFLLFVAPVLGALAGSAEPSPRFALARLAKELKGKPNLTRFVPSRCDFGCGGNEETSGMQPQVAPVPWQGSGDLAAFGKSNCFAVVPEGTEQLAAGETVRILLF